MDERDETGETDESGGSDGTKRRSEGAQALSGVRQHPPPAASGALGSSGDHAQVDAAGTFGRVPLWRAVDLDEDEPPRPAWRAIDDDVASPRQPTVAVEVLPMPLAAVVMITLAWASLVLALTGPAGVLAGLGSLWARKRFLEMERARPGHQGARVSSWIGRVAVAGAAAGAVMSVVILTSSILVDIT